LKHHDETSWSMDTRLVHGSRSDAMTINSGSPTVEPIYPSTTYVHRDMDALDQAFSGKTAGGDSAYVYARQGNPNAQSLENQLAEIEGGTGAIVFGSGMAAIHAALLSAGLAPGVKILVSQDLYGPTIGMLRAQFVPIGVQLVLHDLCSSDVMDYIRAEQPDVIYVETLSNPLVKITDLDAISTAAREVDAITIVDSTFTTPYLVRPLEHGFDIVIHSATKYMGGHGDTTAGVLITSKNNLLAQARTYATMLGAMLGPFDAYLVKRGLKTLALRMERQCNNALQVAQFLQQHDAIERVHYPGLSDHPQHALASRLLREGFYGGLLSFELREQTREAVYRFINRLQLCLPATTLGDVYTEVSYPTISSHRNLTPTERAAFGITDGCIRLSAGIEDVRDILADLQQALDAILQT
jgi:cystathionine beta-lyase/cystathionine gamma-synthase